MLQQLANKDWKTNFEPLHSLNFGIGNDRTEHVLWRIENGELDFDSADQPKVVVELKHKNSHMNRLFKKVDIYFER